MTIDLLGFYICLALSICFACIALVFALLKEKGARIHYFSPTHDEKLPEKCHALLLGGGYPELYAEKLSGNKKMRMAIKEAIENGALSVERWNSYLKLKKEARLAMLKEKRKLKALEKKQERKKQSKPRSKNMEEYE